jgi:hypothetical protein
VIWRLKIQSKIKIFMWRALHGILPLKSILANRHIGTSGQCSVCSQAPEDILHLLFNCEMARQMWDSLGLTSVIEEACMVDRAGSAFLEFLMREEDKPLPGFDTIETKETIAVTCWYLWWLRHRRTHDESVPPIFSVRYLFSSLLLMLQKFLQNKKDPSLNGLGRAQGVLKSTWMVLFILIPVQDLWVLWHVMQWEDL